MGRKKLKNPFQTRRQQVDPRTAMLRHESDLALAEYNARKVTRQMIATDDEMKQEYADRDAWMESWMFGCLAIVLKRRYRFTAPKITEILQQIQALHNEIFQSHPECETYEDVNRVVAALVWEECRMKVFDDDVEGHNGTV